MTEHQHDDGCTFAFNVFGIPGGHEWYQVEVTHRGKVTFSSADAQAGKVTLTLGS